MLRFIILLLIALTLRAQAPTTIPPNSPAISSVVNGNFSNLYTGKVGRWFSNGPPGSFPLSLRGDTAIDVTNRNTYTCYAAAATPCTAVGSGNWQKTNGSNCSGTTGQILVSDGGTNCTGATPTISGSTITGSLMGAASLNLLKSSNLSDLANAATARTNLGITQGNIAALWSGGTNCGTVTNAILVNGNCATPGGNPITGGTTNAIATAASATTLQALATAPTINASTGLISAPSGMSTGASPPAVTIGTGGVPFACTEGTAPSVGPAAGVDIAYCDSTTHKPMLSNNNGSYFALTQTIAKFSQALGTSAIASGDKASLVTVNTTGVLTTDVPSCSFNGDFTGVTGYIPATAGMLTIGVWPTADHVNIQVINNTLSPVTPGALTLNCVVTR